MKKIFDLPVCGYDRAKSFYGKAKVIETDNGEKVLQSYNTFVCRITAAGRFVRMWGVKQVGYVITGKTEFDKGDYTGYSTQYIDLWITILTVVDTVF